MSVTTTPNRIVYTGNNTTTQFFFPYYFANQSDLVVYIYDSSTLISTPQTLGTNYTVVGAQNSQMMYPSGATIIMTTAPSTIQQLLIVRAPQFIQNFTLTPFGTILSQSLMATLDQITLFIQRIGEQAARSVSLPDGFTGSFNPALPVNLTAANAGQTLAINPTGTGFALGPAVQTKALVPLGGTQGQVLVKNSSTAYDFAWANNPATGLSQLTGDVTTPAGAVGQVAATISGLARTKLASGTAAQVLVNDASGNMTSEAQLAKVRGGSGQDNTNLVFPASGSLALVPGNGVVFSSAGALSSKAAWSLSADVAGILPVALGGTGQNSTATYPASGTVAVVPSAGVVYSSSGQLASKAAWSLSADVTGVLPAANGGTGQNSTATYPASGTVAVVPATGVVYSASGALASKSAWSLSSDVSGILPAANGGTGQNSTATYPASGTVAVVPAAGVVFSASGALASKSAWSLTSDVSGVLPIANGGTALSSAPTAGFVISNGSAFSSKAAVVLTSDVSGTLPIANGGTALSSAPAAGFVTSSGTAFSSKSAVSLTSDVSGILPTAAGGTGANTTLSFPTSGTVATTSNTETFSNKTLTGPVIDIENHADQSTTPATPAAGTTKVYTKAGQLYKLANDGLETLVGSGSGSGSFNYLANGGFESGIATAGLATVTVTNGLPSGAPTTSASTLTLSANTSGPLRGARSLSLAGVNWAQGQGVLLAPTQTMNPEDYGKVLTYSLAYQVTAGASLMNFSGLIGSQNMAICVYDVTNSAWLPAPAGSFGINSSTIPGIVAATFQCAVPSSTQQYQFYLFNLGAAVSGNTTVLLDDVVVGPVKIVQGAIVTAWQTYTPVIGAVTTAPTRPTTYTEVCRWRRNGGDMEIEYYNSWSSATGAAAGSGAYLVGLPAIGVTADTALKPIGANQNVCGTFRACDNTNAMIGSAFLYSATQIACYGKYSTAGAAASSITDAAWGSAGYGFTNANGTTTISFTAKIPIAGWAGGTTQMSADTDTRVVAAQIVGLPTTGLSTTAAILNFPTVRSDTHAAYQAAGNYVVPVTGYYRVTAATAISGTFAANQYGVVYLYRNGAAVYQNAQYAASASTTALVPEIAGTVLCNAGDLLAIYAKSSGSSLSYTSDATFHYFNVERVSGPSAITATETVAMRYTNIAGTSIASGATTAIPFPSKSFDTHSSNGATSYVVPVSGKYRVTCTLYTAAMSLTTAQTINHSIYLNGSAYSLLQSLVGNGAASALYSPSGSDTIQCNANDQIAIYVFNGAGAAITLNTGAGLNHLSIERIGN